MESDELPVRKTSAANTILLSLIQVWAWVFLAVLILVFIISVPLVNGISVSFLTIRNSQNILVAITPVLLLGLGQTFVIITGGIDLSVGWVMSLASVLSALALREVFNAGLPLPVAVLAGLLAAIVGGGLVGFFNGTIIARLKVPPFIVTLGMSFIMRGVALLLSENTTVIGLPRGVRDYGNESLMYFVRGDGGGLYFFSRPELTGDMLRRLDRIITYPVLLTAVVVAWWLWTI